MCYCKTSLALHQRRQAFLCDLFFFFYVIIFVQCIAPLLGRSDLPSHPTLLFSSPALAPMQAVVVGTCHAVAQYWGLYSVILIHPYIKAESTQQRQHILTGWYYYYSNCMIVSQSHSVLLITFILFY